MRESVPGGPDEWPPVVSCSRCGRQDCSDFKCVLVASQSGERLTWEQRGAPWYHRLWHAALSTSIEPERTFGALAAGGFYPALLFGCLCEAFAISSFAVVAVPLIALFPDLATQLLYSHAARAWALGLFAAAVLLMVGLHLLWGVCIELGARVDRVPPEYLRGMRFGLYACGWDLLTSPLGLLVGVITSGWHRAVGHMLLAARAPRKGLRAYTHDCRGLSRLAERRGIQLSIVAFTVAVLGALFLALYLVWCFTFAPDAAGFGSHHV
jgi:hypothetical protein